MNICVYCSSSQTIDKKYFRQATLLGKTIALKKHSLVYGGGKVGLMGEIALTVKQHKGQVIGVIPENLKERELAFQEADELIITKDIRERKKVMEEQADSFIALPGGFGTLEELLEIITLKQLNLHNKPIVLLNVDNFYDNLIKQFDLFYKENFAYDKFNKEDIYHISQTVEEAINYIEKQNE